jgi:iron-sulfur cluster assembly protein
VNITVTDVAQTRLTDLLGARAESDAKAIRIFTAGGGCGCSGPRFGMGLDEVTEEDAVVRIGTLTFIVDPMSAPSLEDASIDYVEDVMQQGFSINAPNAQAGGGGCACGSGGCH